MRTRVATTCIILFLAATARAEDVTLLCRDFEVWHDLGIAPIAINASNYITGLDVPDEYIQTGFTISGFGSDRCELIAMGVDGVPYRIVMTLIGAWSGEVQEVYFDFIGSGFEG
jgi:hypothetical protein